jgi:hypothetical protein
MKQYSLQEFFQAAQAVLDSYQFSLPGHYLRVLFELGEITNKEQQKSFSVSYLPAEIITDDAMVVFASTPGEALDMFRTRIKSRGGYYTDYPAYVSNK